MLGQPHPEKVPGGVVWDALKWALHLEFLGQPTPIVKDGGG